MQTTEVTNAQLNHVIVDPTLGVNPSSSHPRDNTYHADGLSWYDAVVLANRLSLDEGLSITTVTQNAGCTGL